MSEEDVNSGVMPTEETATSTPESGEQNNTAPVSEDVTTQQTGEPEKRDPSYRIRQLIAEKKQLEDELAKAKPKTTETTTTQGDDVWKRKVDLALVIPDHLKPEVDGMAKYWANNPNMPADDVIALWDKKYIPPKDQAVIDQAASEANSWRTGGTPNPSARQETKIYSDTDDEKTKAAKLRAHLENLQKQGVKL